MTLPALNDWNTNPDPETLAYHARQQEPYRITVAFAEFIRPLIRPPVDRFGRGIFDLGCGAGHATKYLASKFPDTRWNGLDISMEMIKIATRSKQDNVVFTCADICNLPNWHVDGVVSLQTLSWMPGFEKPIVEICTKLTPQWMAFSSLFYPGDISCNIVVDEPQRPRRSYYNIYSVTRIQKFLTDRGYRLTKYEPFDIDVELPKPADANIMKSYTEHGKLFSGPLYLPQGFLAFEKMP